VRFANRIEEDLSRHDFTMNAIAARMPDERVVDPFRGRGDIARRLARCDGSADERLAEDGLRALRFASRLGFSPDEGILRAIRSKLALLCGVSAEKTRDELKKIIASRSPPPRYF
jgi:tRNA nucleotidyltransferase/poly(A) polymerase